MKLTVCFKTIHDYGMVPAPDWQIQGRGPVDLRFARQVFNCYEESALEMALALGEPARSPGGHIKDRTRESRDHTAGRPVRVERTALTVDDHRADLFLRHLSAVGFDRAIRVAPDADPWFSPRAVAEIIAAWAKKSKDPDLLVFGPRGGAGEHGQTGPLVAEMLGWPCLMSVTDLDFDDAGRLQVLCRTDRAGYVHTVVPPLVLVVGNATAHDCLRIPTIKQKLDARKQNTRVLTPADLGVISHDPATMDPLPVLAPVPASIRHCTMIAGDSSQKKAQQLFDRYLASGRMPGLERKS